jgi:zinc transporter ZupT
VSNDPTTVAFIGGLLTAGFAVAALFFLRFWKRTGDGLFLTFAGAFVLLAVNQALPVLLGIPSEDQGYVYLLRLAGFALIIWAVLRKNMRRG